MCASSWVMWRTRISPCSVPLGSWRWTSPCSEKRIGSSRWDRGRSLNSWTWPGAVHRLEAHRMVLDVGEVHVVAVVVPVPRGLEQVHVEQDRRLDLAIAAPPVLGAPEIGQLVPDRHPRRLPQRHPGRQLGEGEQAQLTTELAVVVGPRALEQLLERLEVLVGEEGGPIDAREHLALGVPTPVGAGDRLELERLDALGGGRMGPAAEVGEGPVGVQRDGLERVGGIGILDEVLDELDLVGLLLQVEPLERLLHAHLLAQERLVGVDVGLHRRLDPGEVRVVDDDAVGEVEVVVEAVLDGGPDADLHARIELEHRGGEHVSGVVADEREGLLPTAVGEDLELGRVRRGWGSVS